MGPPDMNVYLMSLHHQISKMGSVWVGGHYAENPNRLKTCFVAFV